MKTFRQFKEDYQIGEDLAHAEKRYHQSRAIFNKRAGDLAKANPNTTKTSPEQYAKLDAKADRSLELNKQKTQRLKSAEAADRKANPPKPESDYEYNARYPKGHVAGD
jgi:hypothetical protein